MSVRSSLPPRGDSTISQPQPVDDRLVQFGEMIRSTDWIMVMAKVGLWLAVLAFGGVFWAINGGFSVLGLETMSSAFNDAGRIFWVAVSAIRVPVPVSAPGLPATQPLLPWLGVIAASLIQIAVVIMRVRGRRVPIWLVLATGVLSLYDFGSTYYGLGTVVWVQRAGPVAQIPIALVMTFVIEVTVGLITGKRR